MKKTKNGKELIDGEISLIDENIAVTTNVIEALEDRLVERKSELAGLEKDRQGLVKDRNKL